MSFDADRLVDAIERHGSVVRVVVAEVSGSTPREVGAAMLVWSGGQSGTIGGGALEFSTAERAREMLSGDGSARISRHALGPSMGQCCGGAVTLISEMWTRGAVDALPDTGPVVRRISGGAAPPLAIRRAQRNERNSGTPPALLFTDGWILEPRLVPVRPIWIYGAGHVGRALVAVLGPLPEVSITWVDTAPERFPDEVHDKVTILSATDPAQVVRRAPPQAEHLILTYSHEMDLEICHAVLNHAFSRAGLIGSATKWARFRSRLRKLCHKDAQIARISCPIGDPAFGKHPQAIAVGVAAEILKTRRARPAAKDGTA
ncbi:MAG: xanthine dehydrogenase accessory protein XdhC [Pseudomonadota bacterium]